MRRTCALTCETVTWYSSHVLALEATSRLSQPQGQGTAERHKHDLEDDFAVVTNRKSGRTCSRLAAAGQMENYTLQETYL